MNHPLVYCNGDSYSAQNYHRSLVNRTYANIVGQHLGGFVINHAKAGSCNRRIIRTSVYDLLEQRQLNPTQPIYALINLSFEIRGEIWVDQHNATDPKESNFVTHQFSKLTDWKERLLNFLPINSNNNDFLDKYDQGRAYLYSSYAERTNLMCDLVMFQSLMRELDIKFLMFQGPKAEKLTSEHLIDFFKNQLDTKHFLDFEEFGFIDWCYENKFIPLDNFDRPQIAHYGPDAHRAFAEQIVIPAIEKL